MSELSENWGQVLLTPPKKLHVPLVRVFCAFLLLLSLVQMGLESSEFQKLDTTFKVTLEASIQVSSSFFRDRLPYKTMAVLCSFTSANG